MDIICASMSHFRTRPRLRGTRRHRASWTGRRLPATIACLAFLLQALVPSWAWAIAARHDAAGSQPDLLIGMICSAHAFDGANAVAEAVRPDGPVAPPPLPAAVHCPLCLLPTGSDSAPLLPFFPSMAGPLTQCHPVAGTSTEALPALWQRLPSARAPPTV